MRTAEIESFCRRVSETKPAMSMLTVPIAEAYAVAQAVAMKPQGPLSEARFWQEAFLRFAENGDYGTLSNMAWAARQSVAEYLGCYGEKPDLTEAVRALYYAAHWAPDRDCDADGLWRTVRDAAGFGPGKAPTVVGGRVSVATKILEGLQEYSEALEKERKPQPEQPEPELEPTTAEESTAPQPKKTLEELTGTSDKIEWMKYADRGPYPEPTAAEEAIVDAKAIVAADEIERVRQHLGCVDPRPAAVEQPERPEFPTDCADWVFLGRSRGADLYYCKGEDGVQAVHARYGSPFLSISSAVVSREYDSPRLAEADRRATAWGLLSETPPEPTPEPTAAVEPQEPCIVRGRMLPIEPQAEPDEQLLEPDTIAVSPLEPKGLEWRFEGDVWVAVSWAGPAPWKIHPTFDGMFRPLNSAPFATLAEAQAWCQEREDKLLAEQEGKPDA